MAETIDDRGRIIRNGVPQLIPPPRPPRLPQQPVRQLQAQVSADGDVIPIIYGAYRVGAQVLTWVEYRDRLLVHCQWCIGGKYGIGNIFNVYINNEPMPSAVTVDHQLGTTDQIVRDLLKDAIPGYDDNLVADVVGTDGVTRQMGVANSLFDVPANAVDGVPIITAVPQGMYVHDPRIGLDPADQANYVVSRNPSLQLADFITDPTYGWGKKINLDSVIACANYNDELIGSTTQKRRESLFIITQRTDCSRIVAQLADLASCFVNFDGDEIVLTPDGPSTPSFTLNDDSFIDGTMKLMKGRQANAPTVVEVEYTDVSTIPWSTARAIAKLPGVDAGLEPWRYSLVQMPGIFKHDQAEREATERLNRLTRIDLRGSHTRSADALRDLPGDLLEITHNLGLRQKIVRVLSSYPVGPHQWRQTWEEYDVQTYSNEVIGTPPPADTNLPNPFSVPKLVFPIEVEERPYTDQNGRTYSTLRVSWQGSEWSFTSAYEVRIQGVNLDQVSTVTHSGANVEHSFVSHDVKQDVLYSASVSIVGTIGGVTGEPTSAIITLLGKLLNPTNVQYVTGFEAGQYVYLRWSPAIDEDLTGYQIRSQVHWQNLAWEDQDIEEKSILANEAYLTNQAIGRRRYSVRAHDSRYDQSDDWDFSVGFSPVAATTEVEVTQFYGNSHLFLEVDWSDTFRTNVGTAFVAGQQVFAAPHYGETWRKRLGGNETWEDIGSDHWILPYDNYLNRIADITSQDANFGADYIGKLSWDTTILQWFLPGGIGEAWEEKILWRTDSVGYQQAIGRSAVGTAKYIRIEITEDQFDDLTGFVVQFPITVSISQ